MKIIFGNTVNSTKKAPVLFLLWFFVFTVPLFTQEDEDNDGIYLETDWYGELPSLYSLGDKTFSISLGLTFPTLFFRHDGKLEESNINPAGGTGSLSLNVFLNAHIFLGGEIGGQFNGTLGQNMLYIIPIGFRAGYQFLVSQFEIPLSLVVGFAPQRLLNLGYIGLFLKGVASAYYRFNPDWSFGIDLSWTWIPQRPRNHTEANPRNADGNFANLIFSARYHF